MPGTWTEWRQGVVAAFFRVPGPPPEPDAPQEATADPEEDLPSYNALVHDAVQSEARTVRMDHLDKNRTQDRIELLRARHEEQRKLLKTIIVYGTGSVVVVLVSVGGVIAVAGAFGVTSPYGLGPLILGPMSLITGLWVKMGRLVAEYTAVARSAAELSADRRAVVPEPRSADPS